VELAVVENKLEDFLDLNIEDDAEIVDILHYRKPVVSALDLGAVFEFVKEWNESYCEENNLCPECRSPLINNFTMEEYWGSMIRVPDGTSCINGCC